MKKDLEFLVTGIYRGLSIGDSIEKQLTIRIKSSGVDLIFDLENQNEAILQKVILCKQFD